MPVFHFAFPMISHLDENTLRLFAAGRLDAERDSQIESHLTDCTECLERLHRLETEQPSRLIQEIKSARLDDSAESVTVGFKTVTEKSDFVPGDRIGGNYRLENQVGRGGMGVAWKAYDETAERYVVLKFVPKEIQHVAEAMNSVRESFQKVHALQHQNICPLYGLFNDPKYGLFLVMKFVDGLTLNEFRKQHVDQYGRIPLGNIVQILMSLADGLDYAHRQKVVHRDIKPQNVIVSPKDGVQIIDFGLADEIHESLSRTENSDTKHITGTRSYMAPEQWEGRKQDAKTDQYALAVTAYELLAGHVPFSVTDTEILKNAVLHNPPTPIPDLPEHVNAALLKGLAKNQSDRYSTCKAFVEALANPSEPPRLPPPLPPIKTKSIPWKAIRSILRISTILLLSVAVFFTAYSFLKPINTDIPAVDTPKLLPAKQPNYSNDKNIPQSEPVEKRVKRSLLDEQARQSTPPSVIRSQRTQVRAQVFNVLRVAVVINADGSGQLTAMRGKSSERPLSFQGTPFDSHVFDAATTFRGENSGTGRILFPLGYLMLKKSTGSSSPGANGSYGWECRCFGESYDQGRAGTRFSMDKNDCVDGFLQSRGILVAPGVNKDGSRAGFGIGKAGALPYTVAYEVVDDTDYPPDFEVVLHGDGKDGIGSTTFSGLWERDGNNRPRLKAFCFESPTKGKRTLTVDDIGMSPGMVFTKAFQLPSGVAENVKAVEYGLWTNQSPLQRKSPTFELTLLDIIGRFKGNAGFRIENKGDTAVVGKEGWSNPVAVFPNAGKLTDQTPLQPGDTVLGINGKSDSTATLRKLLDSLSFGDFVTVRYMSKDDGNAYTSRYYAQ